MVIYVFGGTNAVEKVKTVAEAQALFEHYVINEERCSVWRGDPASDGVEVWRYDPDTLSL